MPTTFRKVSCWPANDASGRSSAVADERTANEPLPSASSLAKDSRMADSSSAGNGASIIHWRISEPAAASARTSSGSSVDRRSAMRCSSDDCFRNARNASAVVAKPPGTRTPAPANWLIISPSEAFLPPTESTSVMRSCSKDTTYDIKSPLKIEESVFAQGARPQIARCGPGDHPGQTCLVWYSGDC